MSLEMILLSIWFIHQTMNTVGVKGYVDRPPFKSPDTVGWAILASLFLLYILNVPFSRLLLTLLAGFATFGVWSFHWKLFFFGASERKIAGYNEYFANTHRILPASDTRLVPDTYHMIHSVIFLTNFIVLAVNLIRLGV